MIPATDKATRLLLINEYLISGRNINLQMLADKFEVSKRTIQRDIDEIKMFHANKAVFDEDYQYVYYDRESRGYKLE